MHELIHIFICLCVFTYFVHFFVYLRCVISFICTLILVLHFMLSAKHMNSNVAIPATCTSGMWASVQWSAPHISYHKLCLHAYMQQVCLHGGTHIRSCRSPIMTTTCSVSWLSLPHSPVESGHIHVYVSDRGSAVRYIPYKHFLCPHWAVGHMLKCRKSFESWISSSPQPTRDNECKQQTKGVGK